MKKIKEFFQVSMKFIRSYVRLLRKEGYKVSTFIVKCADLCFARITYELVKIS